jgi:NRPS condensation-like uncharacterized protein
MPKNIEDAYPLSMLQSGMLFHSEYAPESAVYQDVISYRVGLPFDKEALERAVEQTVERHEILRTSVDVTRFSEPLQIVHRKVQLPLEVIDLRSLGEHEQHLCWEEWLKNEKSRRFDWNKAPLFRMCIHWLGERMFLWNLSFHHAILDGWSEASLIVELLQRYEALRKGECPVIEKVKVRYRDYIALEREALQSETCRRFWEEMLHDYRSTPVPFAAQTGCRDGQRSYQGNSRGNVEEAAESGNYRGSPI